jgi:hypothetical protein
MFVKTMFPPLAHEVPVTAALAAWAPDRVTPVVAGDATRRFLLMEDAGQRLRATIERDRDVRHWRGILPRYAELQLAIAAHADELVAIGAPDRRGPALISAFEALVSTAELLTIAGAHSLTADELQTLRALAPRIALWCGELAETAPDTIQHDDLHDGQIFIRDGVARFLDWGDANVSHPFFTLVVLQRSLAHSFGCAESDPRILRLRDEYLEPFTALAPRSRIDACLPAALVLGRLCRALTWTHVVRGLPPEHREREAAPGWFQVFLDAARTEDRALRG